MRLYWEVARRGFRRFATYRGATVAGLFTNTVFGFMMGYVFLALHRGRPVVGGWDVADTLTYNWVAQGMLMVIQVWGWFEIALSIRSGDVVTDLYRPIDYQFYWLAQDLGRAAYHAVFRGIPPFLLGSLVFELRVPENPLTWLAFATSVGLAVCVSFALRFMLNLAAFWVLDYRGVFGIASSVVLVFSGFVIPLPFFPDWAHQLSRMLPFSALVQVPVDVFLERHGPPGVLALLGFQALWSAVLLAAGRAVLGAATKRVVVQGG